MPMSIWQTQTPLAAPWWPMVWSNSLQAVEAVLLVWQGPDASALRDPMNPKRAKAVLCWQFNTGQGQKHPCCQDEDIT